LGQPIGINAGRLNDGHITFNDFEATFEHRLSHGLYTLSSYTFSKLIGHVDSEIGNQAGAQNTYNRRLDKAVSSADPIPLRSRSFTTCPSEIEKLSGTACRD